MPEIGDSFDPEIARPRIAKDLEDSRGNCGVQIAEDAHTSLKGQDLGGGLILGCENHPARIPSPEGSLRVGVPDSAAATAVDRVASAARPGWSVLRFPRRAVEPIGDAPSDEDVEPLALLATSRAGDANGTPLAQLLVASGNPIQP